MDNQFPDDLPLPPHETPRRITDPEALDRAMSDSRLDDDSRRDEQTRIHEAMKLEGWVRELPSSAIVVEDEEKRKELLGLRDGASKEELDRVTRQESEAASSQATAEAPGLESHEDALERSKLGVDDFDSNGSTVDKVDKATASAEKPTSLESALTTIRLSPDRQQRLVITGNDDVKRKFYELLAKDGKVFYQGGTPIIAANRKEVAEYLNQAAQRVPGASAVHALSVEMDRDKPGFLGGITSGIANRLGRKHEIDTFVVGTEKEIASGLKDVKDFVSALQHSNVIPSGEVYRGESLVDRAAKALDKTAEPSAEDRRPIELRSVSSLYSVLETPLDKVAAYQAEQASKMEARREFRDQREEDGMISAKAKAADAAAGAGEEKPLPPNKHAERLADTFDKHFQTPSVLGADNGHKQSNAVALAHRLTSLADPVKPELATLPDGPRQTFVAQMAALVEKIGDKEFDEGKRRLPSQELAGESSTVRERMTDFIKLELARDASFEQKLPAMLKNLVDNGAITAEQASSIESKVGQLARELEAAKPAPAPAADATAPATAPEKAPDQPPAEKTPTAPADPGVEATVQQPSAPPTPDQAPSADKPGAEAPTAAMDSPGQSPEAAPVMGKLEAKMEELSTLEPAKVSPDQAMSVLAELDAKQTRPLSELGAGEGVASTQTLTRLEGFLQKAEAGEFGSDAAAYASNLKDALARWQENDRDRAASAGVSAEQHSIQVGQVKSAESAWHDQPSPAQMQDKTTQPAPAMEVETAARVTPEAPAAVAIKEPPPPTPEQLAKEAERLEGVQRLAQTESAAGKLQAMMDNPAGAFTNRDKSWDEKNVQLAADKVLALDPDSVKSLSPGMRERTVVNAFWIASNARDGNLPGFDTPEGKEKVQQMLDKVTTLFEKTSDVQASSAVLDTLKKADAMVTRMAEREREASVSQVALREPTAARAQNAPEGAESGRAVHNLAQDLVHAVYRGGTISEAQVKHFLKNASKLTPQTLKGLDAATKAQSAVALKILVQNVRGGLLGDYAQQNAGMKKLVAGAQQSADVLTSALSKDPAIAAEIAKAMDHKVPGGDGKTQALPAKAAEKDAEMSQAGTGRGNRGTPSMER